MSELPKGWKMENLGTIATRITKGATPTSYGFKYQDTGVAFVKVENIRKGIINRNTIKHFISDEANLNQSRSILEAGDILISIAGTIGTTCLVQKQDLPANTNQALAIIRGTSDICVPEFLRYQLESQIMQEQVKVKERGGGMHNISLEDVGNLTVYISPINEQRRIVAKLEKLLTKVEACQQRLDKIPLILKRFRQSVLAAACSGKLTADWREKTSNIKSALYLQEDIKQERQRQYNETLERAKRHRGLKPKLFRECNEPLEIDVLPEIPRTWIWERLVNISHIQGGVTKGRELKNRDTIWLPYLRVANVQDGYLDLNEIKTIEVLPEDKNKYHLEDGDILFTEGGDRDKLGRGTVWNKVISDCIYQNHIFRARLYSKFVLPSYISLATKSDYARAHFFINASQTVNLASINLTALGKVPIALPPYLEQQEIVRRVEELFKIADQIEGRYQKAKAHVDKLTQSILAKAFRGELVPQDPNDEPASVLLERIKEERAKSTDTKSKPRSSSRSRRQEKLFND
jgi:type I restriction enzyme, S subunit